MPRFSEVDCGMTVCFSVHVCMLMYVLLLMSTFRSLSPASVKIIRVLLDISFIWSSCSKHPITRSQVLPSLVNGGLDDPRDLPNFFYQHLERDIRDLTQLTGKNFEEVIFFLHLIVKSLMETTREQCEYSTVQE